MARAKTRPTKVKTAPSSTALRLRKPTEALAALLRQRARLLKAIAKKQVELERERESAHAVAEALFNRMQPLVSEREALIAEITKLFEELLAAGRLSRSARKKVADVYDCLVETGDFEPIDPIPDDPNGSNPDWDFESSDSWEPPHSNSNADVSSAKHAGGKPGNETLRGLFRRLTMALHPDLVQQEHEQQRRTDVMKEVTRAYEEGNLARLIELEQLWLSGGDLAGRGADDAVKCVELEKSIRELQVQQRTLQSEMRELRANSPLTAMFGRRRVRPEKQEEQIEVMLATASEELEPLLQIREHVRAFSERKISLAKFIRGPDLLMADEQDLFEAAMEMVLNDLDFDSVVPTRGRGRSRGRSTPGAVDGDDCPF